jgi:surface antigen
MRYGLSRMPACRLVWLTGIAALATLLAGCESNQPAEIASLPPALLPNYGLGDSYQFSDGETEIVTAVDDNLVHWRGDGGTYVTSRDILLPRLAWSNANGQGERRIGAGPILLFPLEAGKIVKFTASRSIRPNAGPPIDVSENWACGVDGVDKVTTGAGTFDTWRVDCVMQENPPVDGDGIVRRSFSYAPAIGNFAEMSQRVGDGPVRIAQLTSYTTADPALDVSALRQRSAALQQALESELSGSQKTWSDLASGASGDIVLVDTKRSPQYGWCRDFVEHIQWDGRTYLLRGTGCRTPAKVWNIVALEPGKIGTD